jgi:hypothetical protein
MVFDVWLYMARLRMAAPCSSSDIDLLVECSRPLGLEFVQLAELLETKPRPKGFLEQRRLVRPGW